jgi:DNA end-binding protein Ku
MPRALQSASLAFGLVNIPVKLYTAATSQSVSFHLLHKKDQSRIHEQMVCIAEDTPVSREELVKGYEVKKGTYVEVTEEELDALEAQVNRSVEIQEFIPIEAVDPVSFKKTYYLGPDKGGEKPYQLLAQAMQRERKGAIAQFVQRGKEELVMVRPVRENRLMLHVLYYADEVRAFEGAPSGKAASTAELNLAVQLIHQLASKTWDSAKYHDTYRERVLAFIKKKQAGETMAPSKPARAPGKVLDLMGTLKQSLTHANQPRTTRKNPHTKRRKVKGTRKAA